MGTGSVEGALASGTTAVSIPALDKQLEKQGIDESTRKAILLGASASIGSAVGGDTASTVTSSMQTENNYLSHDDLIKRKLLLSACRSPGNSKLCAKSINEKFNKISAEKDKKLRESCRNNPNGSFCKKETGVALNYIAETAIPSDKARSRKDVLNTVHNYAYKNINNLPRRADYFGAMYDYTGQPWFRAAESYSRGMFNIANRFGFNDWISDAGNVIMKNGKTEFVDIYKNPNQSNSWSYTRLKNEQNDPELQKIHKKHFDSWIPPTKSFVNSFSGGNFLSPKVRIKKGCEKMPEVRECK